MKLSGHGVGSCTHGIVARTLQIASCRKSPPRNLWQAGGFSLSGAVLTKCSIACSGVWVCAHAGVNASISTNALLDAQPRHPRVDAFFRCHLGTSIPSAGPKSNPRSSVCPLESEVGQEIGANLPHTRANVHALLPSRRRAMNTARKINGSRGKHGTKEKLPLSHHRSRAILKLDGCLMDKYLTLSTTHVGSAPLQTLRGSSGLSTLSLSGPARTSPL